MKKNKDYIFLAKALNPLVLILYGILCFYLYSLSQYGGVKRKLPIIIGTGVLLILWFLWCFYKRYKSAVPYNGKLSWFIEDLKNKRQISFANNNIYVNDIEGILMKSIVK